MYYFYIIYSQAADKFYIGHTSNIDERLIKHNAHHKGFTGKLSDWEVVYSEIYQSKIEAYARERQIKKWKNKERIMELINRTKS
jgi:putative endonuclease